MNIKRYIGEFKIEAGSKSTSVVIRPKMLPSIYVLQLILSCVPYVFPYQATACTLPYITAHYAHYAQKTRANLQLWNTSDFNGLVVGLSR